MLNNFFKATPKIRTGVWVPEQKPAWSQAERLVFCYLEIGSYESIVKYSGLSKLVSKLLVVGNGVV